ncbi:hypothetical protein A9D12_02845 [Erythrobacter neustonensis]|uniref:Methyltransferase type 11 domain-containing protein n=2 Tax=Erythrobacter neustonensis TaxID=1112 RepID=A0A192D8F6_9SPHN|nr:hypothetical protein A9D12_02845 [Erythrobacter neustonensis]
MQRHFRITRFAAINRLIETLLAGRETITILDVGGRAEYWNMLAPQLREKVHVTLLNYGDELALFSEHVAAGLRFTNVAGNACNMPQYADGSFDLVHSNSVVEHVGSYANMFDFANEIRRVGKAYYVQTPNYWFPIDPHSASPFLHWLPDPIPRMRFYVGVTRRVDERGAAMRLDGTKMIGRIFFGALFPDAVHTSERLALVFVSSLIAARGA